MKLSFNHIAVGAAAFAASVFGGYMYAKPIKYLPATSTEGSSDGTCAFDRLASVYDSIVGSEERYMFYGLLRRWLLSQAEGDVLEISAGTGRNLPHYKYSNLTSLTLTDISKPMLQQAQKKYFDELQLQYKQPDVTVKFLLADAEHIVAEHDQAAVTVPVPDNSRPQTLPPMEHVQRSGSDDNSSDCSSAAAEQSNCIWRYKRPRQQQHSSTDIHTAAAAAAAAVDPSSIVAAEQQASTAVRAVAQPSCSDISNASSAQPASSDSCNSGSSSSWWHKAGQPCACQHHQGSSSVSDGSNSCISSRIEGSTFRPGSFDVVVDTFGLCSCNNPVQVLQQAARLLKPDGTLLLLEHGRSTWGYLNNKIDESAERHHATYGCWANRDILDIVQQAGLVIESSSRYHFGTSYFIVARPPAAADGAAGAA